MEWTHAAPFEITSLPDGVKLQRRTRRKAEFLRWDGRRSLYLGNYKHRRDAGFAKGEQPNSALERMHHPIIDRIFSEQPCLDYPCAQKSDYTRREFGVGEKFGMDFDLSGVFINSLGVC